MAEKKSIRVVDFFGSIESPLTEAKTSKSYNNYDDSAFSTLTLEVTGCDSIKLKVQACMNIYDSERNELADEDCIWTDMGVIDAKKMKLVSEQTISENGIYFIAIEGATRFRLVVEEISGEAKITGTMR